jgi:multiple sugar transport system substrate-binding protein
MRLTGLRIVALVGALSLVLASCSSGGGSSDEGPAGSTTLSLWIFEGEETFLPALTAAFHKEHPDINIKVTEIPEDSYGTKVDTALAAGSPPDIGFLFEPRWVKAGKVLPLDGVVAEHGIDVSAYNQNAFATGCLVDGKVYCLGSYSGAVLLFYNKGLFDEAGISYPSATEPMTIDEYAQVASELTHPDPDRSKQVWGGSADAPFWWSDPRLTFSEDGRQIAGYANDAPTAHMYDVLAGMVADGVAPTESESNLDGAQDLLATGQIAMSIVDNAVAIPALETAGLDWGAAPVPVEQAGDLPWVSSWTDQWAVFSQSEHPDAAKEFVAFVGTEGNRLRADVGDTMPLDLTIAEESGWADANEGRAETLQVIGLARPGLFIPGFWDATAPLVDSFALVADGQEAVQQALDEVAPQMQETLDRAWETWDDLG